jgi:predicted molibdopterin-dependent oxidoreductase YjgC
MFKTLLSAAEDLRPEVEISINGQVIQARAGEPLATAMLNAGVAPFRRTTVSGSARAPLCLMGVCFDCLVQVDGQQNVQSCMVAVQAGMRVQLQDGARQAGEPT